MNVYETNFKKTLKDSCFTVISTKRETINTYEEFIFKETNVRYGFIHWDSIICFTPW